MYQVNYFSAFQIWMTKLELNDPENVMKFAMPSRIFCIYQFQFNFGNIIWPRVAKLIKK